MSSYVIMRVWRNHPMVYVYIGMIEASSEEEAQAKAAKCWPLDPDYYYDAYHVHADIDQIEYMLSASELEAIEG